MGPMADESSQLSWGCCRRMSATHNSRAVISYWTLWLRLGSSGMSGTSIEVATSGLLWDEILKNGALHLGFGIKGKKAGMSKLVKQAAEEWCPLQGNGGSTDATKEAKAKRQRGAKRKRSEAFEPRRTSESVAGTCRNQDAMPTRPNRKQDVPFNCDDAVRKKNWFFGGLARVACPAYGKAIRIFALSHVTLCFRFIPRFSVRLPGLRAIHHQSSNAPGLTKRWQTRSIAVGRTIL